MTSRAPAGESPDSPAPQLTTLLSADLDAGFAEVVRRYQNLVYLTMLRTCAHEADAEDLAAEAFLRAYRALRGYDRSRIEALQLRPWLITIALNTWRNVVRDRSRQPAQVALDSASNRSAPGYQEDSMVEQLDNQRELAAMIGELPEQQRIAIVLRFVCELSVTEVAQVLDCPEGTVKSHVSRGLTRLRERAASSNRLEAMA